MADDSLKYTLKIDAETKAFEAKITALQGRLEAAFKSAKMKDIFGDKTSKWLTDIKKLESSLLGLSGALAKAEKAKDPVSIKGIQNKIAMVNDLKQKYIDINNQIELAQLKHENKIQAILEKGAAEERKIIEKNTKRSAKTKDDADAKIDADRRSRMVMGAEVKRPEIIQGNSDAEFKKQQEADKVIRNKRLQNYKVADAQEEERYRKLKEDKSKKELEIDNNTETYKAYQKQKHLEEIEKRNAEDTVRVQEDAKKASLGYKTAIGKNTSVEDTKAWIKQSTVLRDQLAAGSKEFKTLNGQINQANLHLQKMGVNMSGASGNAQQMINKFSRLAFNIMGMVFVAERGLATITRLIEKGAQMTTMRDAFTGSTVDLENMRRASRGLLSEFDALKFSNKALDLGIKVKDQPIFIDMATRSLKHYGLGLEDLDSVLEKVIKSTETQQKELSMLGIQRVAFQRETQAEAKLIIQNNEQHKYNSDQILKVTKTKKNYLQELDAEDQKMVKVNALLKLYGKGLGDVLQGQQTPMENIMSIHAAMQNFSIKLGEALLPVAQTIFPKVISALKWFEENSGRVATALAVLGSAFVALGYAMSSVAIVGAAANPIMGWSLALAGVIVLISGLMLFFKNLDQQIAETDTRLNTLRKDVDNYAKQMIAARDEMGQLVSSKNFTNQVPEYYKAEQQYKEARQQELHSMELLKESVKQYIALLILKKQKEEEKIDVNTKLMDFSLEENLMSGDNQAEQMSKYLANIDKAKTSITELNEALDRISRAPSIAALLPDLENVDMGTKSLNLSLDLVTNALVEAYQQGRFSMKELAKSTDDAERVMRILEDRGKAGLNGVNLAALQARLAILGIGEGAIESVKGIMALKEAMEWERKSQQTSLFASNAWFGREQLTKLSTAEQEEANKIYAKLQKEYESKPPVFSNTGSKKGGRDPNFSIHLDKEDPFDLGKFNAYLERQIKLGKKTEADAMDMLGEFKNAMKNYVFDIVKPGDDATIAEATKLFQDNINDLVLGSKTELQIVNDVIKDYEDKLKESKTVLSLPDAQKLKAHWADVLTELQRINVTSTKTWRGEEQSLKILEEQYKLFHDMTELDQNRLDIQRQRLQEASKEKSMFVPSTDSSFGGMLTTIFNPEQQYETSFEVFATATKLMLLEKERYELDKKDLATKIEKNVITQKQYQYEIDKANLLHQTNERQLQEEYRLALIQAKMNDLRDPRKNKDWIGGDALKFFGISEFSAVQEVFQGWASVLQSNMSQAWVNIFGEANTLFEQFMQNLVTKLMDVLMQKAILGLLSLIFPGFGSVLQLGGGIVGGFGGGGSVGTNGAGGGSLFGMSDNMIGRGINAFNPNKNNYATDNNTTIRAINSASQSRQSINSINIYLTGTLHGQKFLAKEFPKFKAQDRLLTLR